jgi:hypothetical protein
VGLETFRAAVLPCDKDTLCVGGRKMEPQPTVLHGSSCMQCMLTTFTSVPAAVKAWHGTFPARMLLVEICKALTPLTRINPSSHIQLGPAIHQAHYCSSQETLNPNCDHHTAALHWMPRHLRPCKIQLSPAKHAVGGILIPQESLPQLMQLQTAHSDTLDQSQSTQLVGACRICWSMLASGISGRRCQPAQG